MYLTSDTDASSYTESNETSMRQVPSTVTIRTITKKDDAGEELCLYHLVAGSLTSDDEITSPLIITVEKECTQLFDFIEKRCTMDLSNANVPPEKIERLLCEGPAFIITDFMPTLDEFSWMVSATSILPKISEELGKQVYEYSHPKDNTGTLSICIHEPASPPKSVYKSGNKEPEATSTMRPNQVSHFFCNSTSLVPLSIFIPSLCASVTVSSSPHYYHYERLLQHWLFTSLCGLPVFRFSCEMLRSEGCDTLKQTLIEQKSSLPNVWHARLILYSADLRIVNTLPDS